MSLEEETERLMAEKEQLLEDNKDLAHNCRRLQASLDHLQTQEAVHEAAAQAQIQAHKEHHRNEIVDLEARLAASQKEATKLHQLLLKMRQELGILKAARDFYRNRAAGPAAKSAGRTIINSSRVTFKTRLRGRLRHSSHQPSTNQAISWQGCNPIPAKDEWEDMSADR